jgi:kynurenine formamidase
VTAEDQRDLAAVVEVVLDAHTGLLEAGIPIVENLRALDRFPRDGFVFSAAPIAIVRGAAFPVRAFAEVPPAAGSEIL